MENNTKDIISIVVPVYNRVGIVEKTFNSILTQKDVDAIIEFVVIDDHSTDGLRDKSVNPLMQAINENTKVAKKYKLLYIKDEDGPNGPSKARNTGAKYCNGQYIVFLDSDDTFYHDRALHNLYKEIKSKEILHGPCLVYGDSIMWENSGTSLWEPHHLFNLPKFNMERLLASDGIIPMGSFIFSKEIAKEIEPFKEDMILGEDYEWQMRVASKYNFFHLDDVVLNYYRNTDGQLNSTSRDKDTRDENLRTIFATKREVASKLDKIPRMDSVKLVFPWPSCFGEEANSVEGLSKSINKHRDLDQISLLQSVRYLDDKYKFLSTIPIDVYYNGELYKAKYDNKSELKIVWIVTEQRLTRKFVINLREHGYNLIFTFNVAYSNRLKTMAPDLDVSTLHFPYHDYLFGSEKNVSDDRSSILMTSEDPLLKDELANLKLDNSNYSTITSKDLRSTQDLTEYLMVLESKAKYFNNLHLMRAAINKCAYVVNRCRGRGIIPVNQVVKMIESKSLAEEVARSMNNKRELIVIGNNAYNWMCRHYDYSFDKFIHKFSKSIDRKQTEMECN